MTDPTIATLSSKPASEEIFGRKFEPCKLPCPPPRECHESLRTYKPTYYEPWCLCGCPSTRVKMLYQMSPYPIVSPPFLPKILYKLSGLRMSDCYMGRPRDTTMCRINKYKRDYCRPFENHILPHNVECFIGAHTCPKDDCVRDAQFTPHRRPRFVWHDGFHSLNYAEESFPHNPIFSPAQITKQPGYDLWLPPCVTRRCIPLPTIVSTGKAIPGGEKSVLLSQRPWDPCSTFFGGPGERTKHVRRQRRDALAMKILAEARANPFPCGALSKPVVWERWMGCGGVFCPKRPPINPVFHGAGMKSFDIETPCKKMLEF